MPGKLKQTGVYLSIIRGSIRQKVDAGVEGAVRRDYKLSDGTEGYKHELIYKDWEGVVRDLDVQDSDYGQVLRVKFDDATLSISVESNYFDAFVRKIGDADLKKAISIAPYDFEEVDKRITGVNLFQGEKKLVNIYYNPTDKVSCNGMPNPPKEYENMSKIDWKTYFLGVKSFLLDEVVKVNEKIDHSEIKVAEGQTILQENVNEGGTEDVPVLSNKEESGDIKLSEIPF